jgi:hypothetical protein
MKPLESFTVGASAVLVLIALILIAPILFIWAANTLGANIEHTPLNYLAVIVLLALVRGGK